MNPLKASRPFVITLSLSLLFIALTVFLMPRSMVQALDNVSIYYVAPSCAGVPTPCFTAIQAAVDAVDASTDVIKVAAGTYTDLHARARNDITTTGVVTQVVYVSKTLTIQGGYTTTNWTTSDPDTNLTTLDAQGQGRVVYITGNISPTIEGLRLTGGYAGKYVQCSACGMEECCTDSCNGGGMYVFSATATINNNRLVNNMAGSCEGVDTTADGGGVCLEHSNGILSGNVITGNNAAKGGGVFLADSTVFLSQNIFTSNHAGEGGGVFATNGAYTLTQNTIESNQAQYGGGVIAGNSTALTGNIIRKNYADFGGGGVSAWSATLAENIIRENYAGYSGGGVQIAGAVTLKENTVILNTTLGWGGGVEAMRSNPTLDGNYIRVNTASRGGGMYMALSDATLTNNIVSGNQASGEESWGATSYGSGVIIAQSSAQLLHNTFARNRGSEGSGIYVDNEGRNSSITTAALTNTILVSQSIGITGTAGTTVTLEVTLWGSGAWANLRDTGGAGTILTGTAEHNYWGNPAFVDPDAGNYRLTSTSAAIDRGIDAGVYADLDGLSRPLGAGFDLGAFEYAVIRVYLPTIRR